MRLKRTTVGWTDK